MRATTTTDGGSETESGPIITEKISQKSEYARPKGGTRRELRNGGKHWLTGKKRGERGTALTAAPRCAGKRDAVTNKGERHVHGGKRK